MLTKTIVGIVKSSFYTLHLSRNNNFMKLHGMPGCFLILSLVCLTASAEMLSGYLIMTNKKKNCCHAFTVVTFFLTPACSLGRNGSILQQLQSN